MNFKKSKEKNHRFFHPSIFSKSRSAELTTQQIVLLIILIVSFIVILIFIFFLNPGETTSKEICHNSVILKARSIGLAGEIDCKTIYVCISAGGKCQGFNSDAERKVQLKGTEMEKEDAVMKAIAEEMSDCWWMFGEGKINYGSTGGTSVKCALCSIIVFDDKIQKEVPKIEYIKFYEYLERAKKDDKITYLTYIYGTPRLSLVKFSDGFKTDINKDVLKTNEKYSLITGIDDNINPPFIGGNPDEFFRVYVVPTKQTSSTKCEEFLTRA
jgi:hypothetical protein